MTKHRLELFSDGVFAIVLTLLVLDLRPPAALGLDGLRELIPSLLVHAASFGLVGVLWISHHNTFASVEEVRSTSLASNLFALFWLTLLPFAAKVAAEHPLDSLGPSALAACFGLYTVGVIAARASLKDETEAGRRIARRFRTALILMAAVRLAGAGLAWLSPWWGYGVLATILVNIVLGAWAEGVMRRAGAEAGPAAVAAEIPAAAAPDPPQ